MGELINSILIIFIFVTFINVTDSRSVFSGVLNRNFGSPGHGSKSCARVWNFFGAQIHVGQNEAYGDLGIYNFVPNSITMRQGCVLSMVDDIGEITVVESSVSPGMQCWHRPLSYACCECYGCYGAITPVSKSSCAVMYEHADCSACLGKALEANDGDEVQLIHPDLHNTISSIIVRPECQLEIYKKPNFNGEGAIATGIIEAIEPEWNDQISSYRCTCQNGSGPTSEPPVIPSSTTDASSTLTPITSTANPTQITTSASTPKETTTRPTTPTPTEGTTTPKEATTTPKEATTTPKEATTTPKEATTTPKEATTTPKEATTTPKEATTTPKEATTTPKEATTTPKEEITTPTITTISPSTTPGISSTSTTEYDDGPEFPVY